MTNNFPSPHGVLNLRFLPLKDLVLHEETDPERIAKLVHRLANDQLLKNPLIVTVIPGTDKYLVLDGANRMTALVMLNCRDSVVQVADSGGRDLRLKVWAHLLSAERGQDILDLFCQLPDLRTTSVGLCTARASLARHAALAYVVIEEGKAVLIEGGENLHEQAVLLAGIVRSYRGRVPFSRVREATLGGFVNQHGGALRLVVFRSFRPREIMELALNGTVLPAGITRYVLSRRVLQLNVPLETLRSADSLEDKNHWLGSEIREQVANGQTRGYEEPTVLFNE